MPKGQFPYLTIKDLQDRLDEEFAKAREKLGRDELKAPTRPTLYRLESRGVWTPTKKGSNGWRIFSSVSELEKAVESILVECGVK